jgi:hypothetical protein
VEEIHGESGVGCGLEDRTLAVPEHFTPRGDVGGMVVPDFWREFQVGAFGDVRIQLKRLTG